MALRTITITEVYCTSCGWASRLKGSEPAPSKCPACEHGNEYMSSKPKQWPDKITDKEDDVFDDWDTYR